MPSNNRVTPLVDGKNDMAQLYEDLESLGEGSCRSIFKGRSRLSTSVRFCGRRELICAPAVGSDVAGYLRPRGLGLVFKATGTANCNDDTVPGHMLERRLVVDRERIGG